MKRGAGSAGDDVVLPQAAGKARDRMTISDRHGTGVVDMAELLAWIVSPPTPRTQETATWSIAPWPTSAC
jgi:hypothetical protein